jgi:type II secretory pathway component PulJ
MNPRRRVGRIDKLRRAPSGFRRDDGVTLAELTVTTSIMSVVMAIFTTGVVQLFRAANNNEAAALTQSQLNTAFLRLDRNLRYASGIGPVHYDAAGNTFVEYLNTETATGSPECAQLELHKATKVLRRRVWPQTTPPAGRWAVLANEVNVAKSSFTVLPVKTASPGLPTQTDNTGFQRLTVTLVVASAAGPGHMEATTRITFTALNSTSDADPTTFCKEARP